jgi:L-rhamnose mutarotase
MERHASVMLMKPGMKQEYKRRHDEIWPEMKEFLSECVLENYSIWNAGAMLFQYFEIEDMEKMKAVSEKSEVKKRWDAFMKDIIDEEHAVNMEEMFYFTAK